MSQEYEMAAVRLSKKKKEKWEEYVQESHQPTLSQLIRIATEREIARGNPLEPPEEENSNSKDPAPEVVHKLEEISNKLQSMDRRLSAIESDRYGDEDLTKLATEVYQILPSSISEIQQAVAQNEGTDLGNEADVGYMSDAMSTDEEEVMPPSKSTPQPSSCTGSIDDIAATLDADEEAVQLAINRLQSTTHSVYSTESAAGTVHYYKED